MCNLSTGVLNKGIEKGREEGIVEGTLKTLLGLVHDGLLKVEDAAPRAKLSEDAFREKYDKYVAE